VAGRTGARLLSVNVVEKVYRGPSRWTAIDKRPCPDAVPVEALGLAGDTQCDTRHHGGPDRALYAYAAEEAAWWAAELHRDVPPGLFGENLTTLGLAVDDALIGERWHVGEPGAGIEVEVRLPRIPCANLAAHVGIRGFHRRFAARGRPGAYLAVLRPGEVAPGDPVSVLHRPAHGVTVADCAGTPDPERMRALLDSGVDVAEPLRSHAERVARRVADRA
jgi:MOSC domain-containing protein YiiM